MSFENSDYLYLAQELVGKTPIKPVGLEAKLRSAISRAYYAAFLTARDFLEYNTPVVVPHTGEGHRFVRDEFKRSRDGKWKKIGRYLDFLLENRTFADYDRTVPGLLGLAETVIQRAEEVIKWIEELEG